MSLISDTLGRSVRLRIAAASLRSVEHRGGLDAFLLKAKDEDLSAKTRALKREIAKKSATAAVPAEAARRGLNLSGAALSRVDRRSSPARRARARQGNSRRDLARAGLRRDRRFNGRQAGP